MTSMDDSVKGVKQSVRRERRSRRREIAARRDRTADDHALAEGGIALARSHGIGPGSTVLLYEALAVEPPTAALTAALQELGARVLYPITRADFDLDWHDAADPERTPLGRAAAGEADLALIPGLAVDGDGRRLGQGGGCYDRVIPRLTPGVPVIVLLHPGEISSDPLPSEPHDARVDGVLTV